MGTTDEDHGQDDCPGDVHQQRHGHDSVTDADTNAVVGGIALTGTTGSGTWAYSLDGTTFTNVGTVAESSALLLPYNAVLRYTPDVGNGGTATITYHAWDTTGGASTGTVDLSQTGATGGSTAYSTATDTASLTVTAVNHAPVLTPATPSLGSIDVHVAAKTISLATFINNGTGTTAITDVDTGAVVGGIALTGVTGSGTWAYSLDGTTFTDVGTVSATSALLLPSTAELQYTPTGTSSETATIVYCAWDTTSGTSGTTADTTTQRRLDGLQHRHRHRLARRDFQHRAGSHGGHSFVGKHRRQRHHHDQPGDVHQQRHGHHDHHRRGFGRRRRRNRR